jgi:hypothetical protein
MSTFDVLSRLDGDAPADQASRVARLAATVDQLAEQVATLVARSQRITAPSWLAAPTDPDTVRVVVDGLLGWMDTVFLRYADAAAALPQCWMWHPDVVEELVWLSHSWHAAYQGDAASVALAAEWHDRYRPGVVHRIKATAGTCSLENHTPPPTRATVPTADAVEALIAWWAQYRTEPAPQPTEAQLAATPRRGARGRR